jgi:hypothetical protein
MCTNYTEDVQYYICQATCLFTPGDAIFVLRRQVKLSSSLSYLRKTASL